MLWNWRKYQIPWLTGNCYGNEGHYQWFFWLISCKMSLWLTLNSYWQTFLPDESVLCQSCSKICFFLEEAPICSTDYPHKKSTFMLTSSCKYIMVLKKIATTCSHPDLHNSPITGPCIHSRLLATQLFVSRMIFQASSMIISFLIAHEIKSTLLDLAH